MKLRRLLVLGLLLTGGPTVARAQDAPKPATSGYALFYMGLTPDEETVPYGAVAVDYRSWHFLARYGYEDRDTFSAWVGWVLEAGSTATVSFTPMIGLAVGRTDAVAPGFEFEFDWGGLTIYNESELVHSLDGSGSYFYSWGNASFRVTDWFQPGTTVQRLRIFESDRTVDRGLSLTSEFGRFSASLYGYNPFSNERFYQLGLEWSF
ncbi:MAG TPA: hypothetical protein VF862_10215 [Gemmatimonadales bacterium]